MVLEWNPLVGERPSRRTWAPKTVTPHETMPKRSSEKVDLVRHDTTFLKTGAWMLAPTYTYFLDRGLAGSLAKLFAGTSVVEVGAGKGCYADFLRRAPLQQPDASPIRVRASGMHSWHHRVMALMSLMW